MAINIERLERLAVLLDGYRPEPSAPDFDLAGWATTETRRTGFLWLRKRECGTQGCAVGLACLSGIFANEGLSLTTNASGYLPVFEGKRSWYAVEAFFGLSIKQAIRLFQPDSYPVSRGPLAAAFVAARIRDMIKRSMTARRQQRRPKTFAAVERIKAAALEPVS